MTKVAETAKALRNALKEAFPATKFRVRSNRYPVDSIDIRYADGPETAELDAVIRSLGSAAFSGISHVFVRRSHGRDTESRFWRAEPTRVENPWE